MSKLRLGALTAILTAMLAGCASPPAAHDVLQQGAAPAVTLDKSVEAADTLNPLLPAPEHVALLRRGLPATCDAAALADRVPTSGPAVTVGGFTTDWLGYQLWFTQYFGNYVGGMTESALRTLPPSTLTLCWYRGNFTDDGGDRQLHQKSVIVLGDSSRNAYSFTYTSPSVDLPLAAPPTPGSTSVSQVVNAIADRFARTGNPLPGVAH